MNTEALFNKYYYSDQEFEDGTTQFQRLISDHVSKGDEILEIGAGPSNPMSEFLSKIGKVTGLDVDDEMNGNEFLSERMLYDGGTFPFEDELFDACVSNYVLEHVEKARMHFKEVFRVLKPGGIYLFRTPNIYHYVTAGSYVLPHSMHLLLANRLRGHSEEEHDPWPTVYKANSRSGVLKLCKIAGLIVEDLVMIEKDPSYGRAHPVLFYPMMMYERLVNSTELLKGFRVNILGVIRKPV